MGTLPQLKIIGTGILLFIFSHSYIYSQTDVESLLDSLTLEIEKRKYPGLMISIVRSDTILFSGGIGYADVENKRKVDELVLFRQGSISKSFTALALLKALYDQGLSLHTPIKEIDPELPITNKWTDQSPVTVAHVLEHTTGFDGWHTHAMYNFTDSVSPSGKAMVLSHQNSLKSRWKPGTIHAYNNPGYVVAGHLIEVLSGKSYQEYVKQEILAPIGMSRSAFYFKRPENVPMAKGYNLEREGYVEVPFVSIQGGAAGGLCANAHDMSNYL
ncbi:MAG: serine hydrolase domain-containing protein, partial [Bacteroidota bacterium]